MADVQNSRTMRFVIQGWASAIRDIALELSYIGRFPEAGVAFLGATPTRFLLGLHAGLHVRLAALPTGPGWDLYRPGSWVPHCTLAMGVADPDVSRLLSLTRAVKLPIEAAVVEAGLVEIPSGEVRRASP